MTLWFAQIALQVAFAAGFVSGSTSWFSMHSLNGALLVLPLMVGFPVALLNAIVARGAWWPLVVLPALFFLVTMQMTLGYTRIVGVHIVGGVLVFALALITCIELWRRRHVPRPARRPRTLQSAQGDLR